MNLYEKVEALYGKILPENLSMKIKEFRIFRYAYLSGEHDVVEGLKHMDELAWEILEEYKRLNLE